MWQKTATCWNHPSSHLPLSSPPSPPSFIATDKGDKPPSMKGRRPFAVSSPEMFLWRNYVMFACCAAPNPSNQLNMSGSAEAG